MNLSKFFTFLWVTSRISVSRRIWENPPLVRGGFAKIEIPGGDQGGRTPPGRRSKNFRAPSARGISTEKLAYIFILHFPRAKFSANSNCSKAALANSCFFVVPTVPLYTNLVPCRVLKNAPGPALPLSYHTRYPSLSMGNN